MRKKSVPGSIKNWMKEKGSSIMRRYIQKEIWWIVLRMLPKITYGNLVKNKLLPLICMHTEQKKIKRSTTDLNKENLKRFNFIILPHLCYLFFFTLIFSEIKPNYLLRYNTCLYQHMCRCARIFLHMSLVITEPNILSELSDEIFWRYQLPPCHLLHSHFSPQGSTICQLIEYACFQI